MQVPLGVDALYIPSLINDFVMSMFEICFDSDQPQVSRVVPFPSVDTLDRSPLTLEKLSGKLFSSRSSVSHLPRVLREVILSKLVKDSFPTLKIKAW